MNYERKPTRKSARAHRIKTKRRRGQSRTGLRLIENSCTLEPDVKSSSDDDSMPQYCDWLHSDPWTSELQTIQDTKIDSRSALFSAGAQYCHESLKWAFTMVAVALLKKTHFAKVRFFSKVPPMAVRTQILPFVWLLAAAAKNWPKK